MQVYVTTNVSVVYESIGQVDFCDNNIRRPLRNMLRWPSTKESTVPTHQASNVYHLTFDLSLMYVQLAAQLTLHLPGCPSTFCFR